jgi:hypothetical protein
MRTLLTQLTIAFTLCAATTSLIAGPPATSHGWGGPYQGPGDIVPPIDDEHDIGTCDMSVAGPCGAFACTVVQWHPQRKRCTLPALASSSGEPVWAKAYTLTIADMLPLLGANAPCTSTMGNITFEITSPFPVQEVHIFESAWINGHDNSAAIDDAVPASVCVNNSVLVTAWPFSELVTAVPCDSATVRVTVSAQCLRNALIDWLASGLNPQAWMDKWLFTVDFVSCDPCDTEVIGPQPLD